MAANTQLQARHVKQELLDSLGKGYQGTVPQIPHYQVDFYLFVSRIGYRTFCDHMDQLNTMVIDRNLMETCYDHVLRLKLKHWRNTNKSEEEKNLLYIGAKAEMQETEKYWEEKAETHRGLDCANSFAYSDAMGEYIQKYQDDKEVRESPEPEPTEEEEQQRAILLAQQMALFTRNPHNGEGAEVKEKEIGPEAEKEDDNTDVEMGIDEDEDEEDNAINLNTQARSTIANSANTFTLAHRFAAHGINEDYDDDDGEEDVQMNVDSD
ncbi:hypothetical protein B7494_g4272 [Chlorociboria aeruginascens]|nr:hypothetical protein B7494_g4272 [Chlorociboria aeruginascens]